MGWSLACRNHAACVAFQLVAAAWLERAADRQKPARDTLGVRHRVPQVFDFRRVAARQIDRACGLSVAVPRRHGALYGAEVAFDIPIHVSPNFRSPTCPDVCLSTCPPVRESGVGACDESVGPYAGTPRRSGAARTCARGSSPPADSDRASRERVPCHQPHPDRRISAATATPTGVSTISRFADSGPVTRRIGPDTTDSLRRGRAFARAGQMKSSRRDECGTQRLPLRRSPSVGSPAEYNSPRTGVG